MRNRRAAARSKRLARTSLIKRWRRRCTATHSEWRSGGSPNSRDSAHPRPARHSQRPSQRPSTATARWLARRCSACRSRRSRQRRHIDRRPAQAAIIAGACAAPAPALIAKAGACAEQGCTTSSAASPSRAEYRSARSPPRMAALYCARTARATATLGIGLAAPAGGRER